MKNDIFDLEQDIMHCWNIVDDLKILNEAILERDLSADEISNTLLGIERLYNLKFEKLFEMFDGHCKDYWNLKIRSKQWDNRFTTTIKKEEND